MDKVTQLRYFFNENKLLLVLLRCQMSLFQACWFETCNTLLAFTAEITFSKMCHLLFYFGVRCRIILWFCLYVCNVSYRWHSWCPASSQWLFWGDRQKQLLVTISASTHLFFPPDWKGSHFCFIFCKIQVWRVANKLRSQAFQQKKKSHLETCH